MSLSLSFSQSSAVVPVSAEEISRRSYEQKYLIEEKIITSLVEMVNQGIRDQVSHGLLQYEYVVPSFIYGYPKFDVPYVIFKLRELYSSKGFEVQGTGQHTTLAWKHQKTVAPPPLPPQPPMSKKKFPSLLSS